jgi:hypothetical protein
MTWWVAGLWGLAGGGAIELVDLYKLVRTADGSYKMPETSERFWQAYLIAVAIRLVLGYVSAWALQQADQLDSALAALGVGAGATGFLEHLGRGPREPVADVPQHESAAPG